jgi:transcriptional regulator with XRE-family HTH domain
LKSEEVTVKLGDVLKKERERCSMTIEQVASKIGVTTEKYAEFEMGKSEIEQWGPKLGYFAMELEVPTSRLIAESGRAKDYIQGQCGRLISKRRQESGKSVDDLCKSLSISTLELERIELGESPFEEYAPRLLCFAELIAQPVFNLFFPCGLPLERLDDYP